MTGFIVALGLGSAILLLCARLIIQTLKRSRFITMDDFLKARATLDSVILEKAVMERIFAVEDEEFISHERRPEVKNLFERERKALAVQWLRTTQREIARLMDMHLRLASYTHNPDSHFEVELAINYAAFFVGSRLFLLLVFLAGPFKAARLFSYTAAATSHFYTVFRVRFDKVDPLLLRSVASPED